MPRLATRHIGNVRQHPIDLSWTWEIVRIEQRPDGKRFGTTVALPDDEYPTRIDAREALYEAADARGLSLHLCHIDSPRPVVIERTLPLAA